MSTANIRQKTDQNIRKKTARNSIKKEYHAEINDLICDQLDAIGNGILPITPGDVVPKPTGNIIYQAMSAGDYTNLKNASGTPAILYDENGQAVTNNEVTEEDLSIGVQLQYDSTLDAWTKKIQQANFAGYTPSGGYPGSAQDIDNKKIDKDVLLTGVSINLFDKSKAITGQRVAGSTGQIVTEAGAMMSNLIPVEGDTVYMVNYRTGGQNAFRFLDADMNPMKPIYIVPTDTFAALDAKPYRSPVNAVYAQFSLAVNGVGSAEGVMFAQTSVPIPYQPYSPKIGTEFIPELPYTELGGYTGTSQDLNQKIDSTAAGLLTSITNSDNKASTALSNANAAQSAADNAESLAQGTVTLLNGKIDKSSRGVAGGVASLNDNGKVPASQLDISGAIPVGNWDAGTNTPALSDGVGTVNNYYMVTAPGTIDFGSGNVTFKKGDKVIYSSEGKWLNNEQLEAPAPVSAATLATDSSYIRVNDSLFNIFNENTRQYESYNKVTTFPNGFAITDDAIDNVIYRKIGNEYFANTSFLKDGRVDIKSYGCKVDGVTNDQPLTQKLVDFLAIIGGGTVTLPKGRIRLLNAGIRIQSGVSISGKGMGVSVLQCDSNTTSNVNKNGIWNTDMPSDGSVWNPLRNIHLTGFTIDCTGYHDVGISYVGRKGIFILGMEYFIINQVEVYKSIGTGIGCDFLSRGAITNCIVRECGMYIGDGQAPEIGQSGIGIGSCSTEDESVLVEGNWCIHNGNFGIFLETQNNPSGIKSKWAKIVNNHCLGGRYGIGNKGSGGAIISGNTCYYASMNGIHLQQKTLNNIVTNNDCGYNTLNGIYSELIGDVLDNATLIGANKAHHNGRYGIYAHQGIPTSNMQINENIVYNNGYSGILMSYHHYNNRARGNTIFNNGQAGLANNNYGIYARQGYGTLIEENYIYDNQATPTQLKALHIEKGHTDVDIFPQLSPIILKGNIMPGYERANAIDLDPLFLKEDVVLKGNIGFEDEIYGNSTINDNETAVLVNHGLGFVPSIVSLTPQGDYNLWVSDINNASFTVNRTNFDGAVGFYWKASL